MSVDEDNNKKDKKIPITRGGNIAIGTERRQIICRLSSRMINQY